MVDSHPYLEFSNEFVQVLYLGQILNSKKAWYIVSWWVSTQTTIVNMSLHMKKIQGQICRNSVSVLIF